jgi:hypothetical protein
MIGATVEFRERNIVEELRRSVKRKWASIAQERRILRQQESVTSALHISRNRDLHTRCTGKSEKPSQKAEVRLKK